MFPLYFGTPMSDYAARIRAARGYAGITQKELADQLGTTAETIKRREAGRQGPKRGELLAIAAVCGVPPAFMEHGFGEIEESDILERLDRIEAALLGADIESMRDYARHVVTELREGGPSSGSGAPTPRRGRGPRRAAQ